METSEYEKQANKFLLKTNTSISVTFLKNDKHFIDDKETRDIYEVEIKRGQRKYKFNFGQSINCSGKFWVGYKMAGNNRHKNAKPYNDSKEAQKAAYFGGSMVVQRNENFEIPSNYSILTCLQKYDPGTLENFCDEFGYNSDSIKHNKIYEAVKEEYQNLTMIFTDSEIEELQEIQ